MYAKNPNTGEVEEVAKWDQLWGDDYTITFKDGSIAMVPAAEVAEPPKFEPGDLVNRMIDATHPDPTRMEGRVNRRFFEYGWTYEIFWNIWSLEDPSANRIGTWAEADLEKSSEMTKNIINDFYLRLNFKSKEQFSNYLKQFNLEINDVEEKLQIEALWNQLVYNKFMSEDNVYYVSEHRGSYNNSNELKDIIFKNI